MYLRWWSFPTASCGGKRLLSIPVILAQKKNTPNLGPTPAEAHLPLLVRAQDVSWQNFTSVSEMAQVGDKTLQSKSPLCRSNGCVSATQFSALWRNLECFCCSTWDRRSQASYASQRGVLPWHGPAQTKWFHLQELLNVKPFWQPILIPKQL